MESIAIWYDLVFGRFWFMVTFNRVDDCLYIVVDEVTVDPFWVYKISQEVTGLT